MNETDEETKINKIKESNKFKKFIIYYYCL